MKPEPTDSQLLMRIYHGGESVHADRNVDHRPYKRLVDLGWISSQPLSTQDIVYQLTLEGLELALEIRDAPTPGQ